MKKTFKQTLAIFLTVIMAFSVLPVLGIDLAPKASALSASGQITSTISYTYDNDTGTLTISGTGNMPNYESCKSPFYRSQAKRIIIEAGITSIGKWAFENCEDLVNITISESVENIGDYAFYGCGITSIDIPSSVKSMGIGLFHNCFDLESVIIPNSITEIGYREFYNCFNLTDITIPKSVTSVGKEAFAYCRSLLNITIPDGVTSIGELAFLYCESLENIIIPDSVTSIVGGAFYYCSNLKNVTLPDSLTDMKALFLECKSLESIVIPNGTTRIYDSTFLGCESLKSITLPDSITAIGDSAFGNCCSLTEITIPEKVTSIGMGAFEKCDSLQSITIPNGVSIIDEAAFRYCKNLRKVIIPDSVTHFGGNAFADCSNLTIYCYKDSCAHEYAVEHHISYVLMERDLDSVSISDVEINYKDSTKITPKIEAKDGVKYTVEFSSSNPTVAAVDKNGNIYGAGKGTAEITCKVTDSDGYTVKDTCTVTVKLQWWEWIIWILLFGFLWY